MICQVTNIKTKTQAIPTLNRDLLKARHIQAHVKEMAADGLLPTEGYPFSPMNTGPFVVPITRWIE